MRDGGGVCKKTKFGTRIFVINFDPKNIKFGTGVNGPSGGKVVKR
jgi:hypothetical protein